MKVAYISAGAAGSYCGACNRDALIVRELRGRGHDAILVPLYTPLRTDGDAPAAAGLFYGGINCVLQERIPLFRKTPRFLDRLWDSPLLLKAVSRFAVSTRPEELAEMTISVLRGSQGRQAKELNRLLAFLRQSLAPDIVHLTNSLLLCIAPAVKDRIGCAVVCSFQGEDSFLSRFPEKWRQTAIGLMQDCAAAVDLFVSAGRSHASAMACLLRIPEDRVRIVPPAVDPAYLALPSERPDRPFRIGFLSRRSPAKGLDTLVEAFCILCRTGRGDEILSVAGECPGTLRAFWFAQARQLRRQGLLARLEEFGQPDFEGKKRFLSRCSVFCLPGRGEEQRAAACLEALAAGLPVITSATGVAAEVVETTGGGVLIPPDDPVALARTLGFLRDNPGHRARLARSAREGVRLHFLPETMVKEIEKVYTEALRTSQCKPKERQ